MLDHLAGDTRLYFIVGYPIAQVKSPAGITRGFAARSANAVLVPIEIAPDHIDGYFDIPRNKFQTTFLTIFDLFLMLFNPNVIKW